MKCLSKFAAIALFIAFLPVASCKKNNASKPKPLKAGFTVMSNGNDPLIVTYSDGTGSGVDFFGTRNSKGVPLAINQIVVRKNTDTTIYHIDSLGRPVTAIAPNGVQFHFNWIAAQKAALTIISKDGKYQVNTTADFTKTTNMLPVVKTNAARLKQPSQIKFTPATPGKLAVNSLAATPAGDVLVNVSACGSPENNLEVNVLVTDESGNNLGYFPAYPGANGTYIAQLPTNIAPKTDLKDICENVSGVLEKACWATEVPGLTTYLCAAAAVASVEVPPLAAAIAVACPVISTGMEYYCSTIGASPGPGAPSLADYICGSPLLDRTITGNVEIYASVIAWPENAYSLTETVNGSGPFPGLNVDLNSTTTIRTFTLSPSAPVAQQAYVATADIYCLEPGASVTLSIEGTDGYTNSETMTITSNEKSGAFTLDVPGALTAGIQDTVTLTITLPDGSTLTRTAQLVFS